MRDLPWTFIGFLVAITVIASFGISKIADNGTQPDQSVAEWRRDIQTAVEQNGGAIQYNTKSVMDLSQRLSAVRSDVLFERGRIDGLHLRTLCLSGFDDSKDSIVTLNEVKSLLDLVERAIYNQNERLKLVEAYCRNAGISGTEVDPVLERMRAADDRLREASERLQKALDRLKEEENR